MGSGSISKRTGTIAALVVAAVALFVFWNTQVPAADAQRDAAPAQRSREAALTVTVVKLEPVEMTRTVTVNGAVHAWQEVVIGPEVGGYRVAEVYVDVGDRVVKGQKLVQLSTGLLAADAATRQAILDQREAELVNAEAALRRARAMSAMDALSPADLDRLTSESLAARARLDSARADLETSTLRLQLAEVTAPDDGVITARTVTMGEIAQVGNEMLRLLRNGRIEWRGEVPESRLAELDRGQPVSITTADGTRLAGTVRTVAPTVAAANRTGLVYVDLEANERVRPGMFARGEIEIGRGPAFTLPLESVVSADGYSYVFVLGADNIVERRRVETGAVRASAIEVTAGLRTGEMIVEKGAGFLKDGDLVDVAAANRT